MLECNEELPQLNERQQTEFLRILMWGEEEKKSVMEQLTETQKKIRAYKKKQEQKSAIDNKVDEYLKDWHLIEWQMMHTLHQPLSELRKRPYRYFMELYKDLAIITGAKKYDPHRNSQKPDKKGFKREFANAFDWK